jgi:hypothetical protein
MGWSQAKLSAECQLSGWDIGRETIALIESQTRWVGDFELKTLAKALKVPIASLVGD